MQKSCKILILVVMLLFCFVINCNASNITEINQLIENASELNNTEVTIQGELIGEALERDDYVWLNVNDGTNAIGIWVKQSDISEIQYYGDYKHKGDTVKITGVFYNSCTEHGGDVDVHCSDIEVIETGSIVTESISQAKIIAAVALLLIAASIAIVYFKLIKKDEFIS